MKLTNENIANAIEEVQKFFEKLEVTKQDKIKICFLFEESLLRCQEKFGEDKNFELVKRKWFGTPKVLIKIKGDPYNPIKNDSDEQIFSESIMENLLNYENAQAIYRYEGGCNEIILFLSKTVRSFKIPGSSIILFILLSVVSALIVKNFPQEIQNIIVGEILNPILNTLLGTLIAVNIPLIFISIVASICSIEDIAMLNDMGTKILRNFFVTMFAMAFISIFVCEMFFPVISLDFGEKFLANNLLELKQLFNLILSIFPQDIFMAFTEKNVLQIMVLAFVTGICVINLGKNVNEFQNLIMNLRQIIFKIVGIAFKLIPVVIFLFIFKAVLIYSAEEIFTVWKLIFVKYILFTSITLIMLLRNYFSHGIKILDFLKKIYPACEISFKTASGVASLQKNLEVCKKNLKIEETLCDFYIPLSHTLCPTTMVISIVANTFFAAYFSGMQISIGQLLIIAFLSVQFAISAVGGNGGMVATMTLLLTQLEFATDAIAPMTVADIFVINFSILTALIIRDCDLLAFSRTLK